MPTLLRVGKLQQSTGRVGSAPADVTAPTLSSATAGTPTTDGATSFGVTTNEGNGTLYWAVVTNGGSCTDAQLKAGSGGNIVAGKAGSQVVSGTGAQTVTSVTGLSSSTTYQIKFLHRDAAGNDSSQASVSLTTTASDANWANVTLLVGNNSGTNGGTTFTDQSSLGLTVTTYGNTQWSNAQAPTGLTTSMLYDGTGDEWRVPDNAGQTLDGDFTIEAWVYSAAWGAVETIIGKWGVSGTSDSEWLLYVNNGKLAFAWTPYSIVLNLVTSTANIPTSTWTHVAVTRSGNDFKLWIGGTNDGTATNSTTATDRNIVTSSGLYANGGSGAYSGYIASIRVTKGVARYTGSFTPPTLPLPTS